MSSAVTRFGNALGRDSRIREAAARQSKPVRLEANSFNDLAR
jgi:hypothetical protein